MEVMMVLGYLAIVVIAVAWVFLDDSRKRRNALRTRPRPAETSASDAQTTPSLAITHSAFEAQETASDASDLSQGAA
jgi:hypothetical protein